MKMNSEMMQRLRKVHKKKKLGRKSVKVTEVNSFYRHFGVNQMILEEEEHQGGAPTQNFLLQIIEKFTREKFNLTETAKNYGEHEYELKIKRICQQLATSHENQVLLQINPHELLNKHIEGKVETPCRTKKEGKSITFNHIFDMYILLGSHPTWKEQKKLVLQSLLEHKVIDKE